MFILLVLSIIFAAWVIAFRVKKLLNLKRSWPLVVGLLIFFAGYGGAMGSGIYIGNGAWFAFFYNFYGLLFMAAIYFFIYLLLEWIFSRLLKKISGKIVLLIGVCVSLVTVAIGFCHAQSFKITEFEVPVANLNEVVTVMNIPDIHLGTQRGTKYLEKIIATIQAEKPDIVIYNGDLVDSNIALKPEIFALFGSVEVEQYFTLGNHEFYLDTEKSLKMIEEAGITILRNQMVETHEVQLIGLEYMNADRTTYDPHKIGNLTIEEELPKITRDPAKPTILAHHSPVGIKYVIANNIDLMLSGHTHGGQIFPATFAANYIFPLKTGLHKIENTYFAVSQGAGTFGPWMRLGTSNEIQLIRLIPANTAK